VRRRHQDRVIAICHKLEGEDSLEQEVAIPQAARFIDAILVPGEPSEAWGPIRWDLARRPVVLEHFSQPPGAGAFTWAVAKHAWVSASWVEDGPARRKLLGSIRAGGDQRALRAPLLLVLSAGRPEHVIAASGELGLVEAEPGIWRGRRPMLGDVAVVDLRGLAPDRPGTSVLRLMATPGDRTEIASNLDALRADPGVLESTKRRIIEGIMDRTIATTDEEQKSVVDRLLEQGRTEGRAEGRIEGRTEGRAEGRTEEARAAVIRVFDRRGVPLSDGERRQIEAESELERLKRWHDAAVTAGTAAEVLALR
jgi:hypothetical protein